MSLFERGEQGLRRIKDMQRHSFEEGRQVIQKGQDALKDRASGKDRSEALEVMPEEVKTLYTQVLGAQSLADGKTNPKKVADIYLFMSQIGLPPNSRGQVRQVLEAEEAGPSDVLDLARDTVIRAKSGRDEIAFSLVKDMVRISRIAGGPSRAERESIVEVAVEFGYDADEAIALAEKAIENDEAFVRGEIDIGELERRSKQLASRAASIGVPIAAVYLSGSVVGLSAAGITSALAWLGFGGILGLSSMLTGIGVVILIGAGTYHGVRWLTGGKEREIEKQREHMIQEVIKRHQQAMADLADDINTIAAKMEEYTSQSDRNEARLTQLEAELSTFRSALGALRDQEQQYAS